MKIPTKNYSLRKFQKYAFHFTGRERCFGSKTVFWLKVCSRLPARCFDAMAGMTPGRPPQRRRLRSPLHEMDGNEPDDDELLGTPKSVSESNGPSLDAIAAIMRQELHTAIGPLESKLTSMSATFDERVGKIENTVADQDVRIARLEQSMAACRHSRHSPPCQILPTKSKIFSPRSTSSKGRPAPTKATCRGPWWLEDCKVVTHYGAQPNGCEKNCNL